MFRDYWLDLDGIQKQVERIGKEVDL